MSDDYKKVQLGGKTKGTLGKEDFGYYAGMDIWIDMDLTNPDNPKYIEIIRLPDLLKEFMFMYSDKEFEYIKYDLFEMLKEQTNGIINTEQIADIFNIKKQKEIMREAFKDISVPVKSKSLGNGRKEFKIKLTDKETMSLINDSMGALAKSEYLDILIKPALDLNLFTRSDAIARISKFFNELSKINYIGKEGSEFTFIVNSAGYLESCNEKIYFRITAKDLTAIFNAFVDEGSKANLDDVPDGIINLELSYEAAISQIPSSTQIEFPKTTKENTLDYLEYIKEEQSRRELHTFDPLENVDQQREGMTLYTIYGYPIELPEPGVLDIEGELMVPVRAAAPRFSFNTVIYDDDSHNVWVCNYNNNIKVKVGSNIAYVNGEAKEYPVAAQFVGDNVYVPLNLLIDYSFYTVSWHKTEAGWAGILEYKTN
jgi:hypothetical protein